MQTTEEEACALLWRHWQDRSVLDDLPPELKPATREAGYAIQKQYEGYSRHPLAGWKIAATSTAGQRHINVAGPLGGRLLTETILEDEAFVSLEGNRMRVLEPEFAFRFGTDIPPRPEPYSVSDVIAAVSDLHLTLEIPDSRFADFTCVGGPSLIADNACAGELVVSERVVADWRAIDLASHKVAARVEGRFERAGSGASVLGDPRAALAWLVNEVSGLGIGIRHGELVTTGTCMVPLEIEPGDRVVADFGELGSVGVRIAPEAGGA